MAQTITSPPTTGRDLVPAAAVVCPLCGPLIEWTFAQPALFIHGGYGAVEVRHVRGCECGKIRLENRTIRNPKRYA